MDIIVTKKYYERKNMQFIRAQTYNKTVSYDAFART